MILIIEPNVHTYMNSKSFQYLILIFKFFWAVCGCQTFRRNDFTEITVSVLVGFSNTWLQTKIIIILTIFSSFFAVSYLHWSHDMYSQFNWSLWSNVCPLFLQFLSFQKNLDKFPPVRLLFWFFLIQWKRSYGKWNAVIRSKSWK